MSDHLSALDTVALIHRELGDPILTVIEPREGPRALRRAVAAARKQIGTTLIAVPTTGTRSTFIRDWFKADTRDGVQSVPFDGGVLLLLHVAGRPPVRPRKQAPPKPWSMPDAAPVPGATEPDLIDRLVRRVLRALQGEPRREVHAAGNATERYLGGYGLLAHDGSVWRPTVAAMVLCGIRPELFLSGCAVQLEIDGVEAEVRGSLHRLVRDTKRQLPDDVDRQVVSEALTNALVHRDWVCDAPVVVRLDGARLTVTTPGALRRCGQRQMNPLVLHLAQHLGLASGQGRGLRKIEERLTSMRRPPPSLFERNGSVVFVADLRRVRRPTPSHEPGRDLPRVAAAPASSPPSPVVVASASPAEVLAPVPVLAVVPDPPPVPSLLPRDPDDRAAVVMAHLRIRRDASTRELAEALGCSRPVVGKLVSALVAEGRIRPLLASNRSPHQRYALAEDHP